MLDLLRPCLVCGELSERTHCDEHYSAPIKANTTKRGYGWTWQKLSRRARRMQPWCSDCGTNDDLTTDHTPEAWRRAEAGQSIRLQDVDVVCRSCNSKRGAARGGTPRTSDPAPGARHSFGLLPPGGMQ